MQEPIIEVLSGKCLKDGTLCTLTEDGLQWVMPKRTATPHPDLINAIALFDAHCANRTPYMIREDEIKVKHMKWENPATRKVEKWERPVFTDKAMADDFHCTGFFVNDKGAVGMHFTVKQEGKAGTGINVKPISLVEGELFDTYPFIDDLRRVLKTVQFQIEQYAKHGKVDPRSKTESTGNEEVQSVERPVTGIKGIGGEDDGETFEQITARTAGTKGAAAKRTGKGNKQTADNPGGK